MLAQLDHLQDTLTTRVSSLKDTEATCPVAQAAAAEATRSCPPAAPAARSISLVIKSAAIPIPTSRPRLFACEAKNAPTLPSSGEAVRSRTSAALATAAPEAAAAEETAAVPAAPSATAPPTAAASTATSTKGMNCTARAPAASAAVASKPRESCPRGTTRSSPSEARAAGAPRGSGPGRGTGDVKTTSERRTEAT